MINSSPAAAAARTAAAHLTGDYGPGLAADVEAALHAPNATGPRPDQYFDPVSVAGLIVSIASLAWAIYADVRRKTPEVSPDAIARQIRIEISDRQGPVQPDTARITEVVVTEIMQAAMDSPDFSGGPKRGTDG